MPPPELELPLPLGVGVAAALVGEVVGPVVDAAVAVVAGVGVAPGEVWATVTTTLVSGLPLVMTGVPVELRHSLAPSKTAAIAT